MPRFKGVSASIGRGSGCFLVRFWVDPKGVHYCTIYYRILALGGEEEKMGGEGQGESGCGSCCPENSCIVKRGIKNGWEQQ